MLFRFITFFVMHFCRLSFDKSTGWQQEKEAERKQDDAQEHGIFCASCAERVTGHDQAISIAGGHRHHFTNPFGIEYDIALYRAANVHVHGPMTDEHTWFAGYAWQVVICANCHAHLGWRYRQLHSPDFYGLISSQLIEK